MYIYIYIHIYIYIYTHIYMYEYYCSSTLSQQYFVQQCSASLLVQRLTGTANPRSKILDRGLDSSRISILSP